MKLEEGDLVVLAFYGGTLHDAPIHLPSATRPLVVKKRYRPGPGRPHEVVVGEVALVEGAESLDWPTLCGLRGYVYRLVPAIRGRRFCGVCVATKNGNGHGRLEEAA